TIRGILRCYRRYCIERIYSRHLLPNPGCLDKILTDETKENIELVPGSKKRSKNLIKLDITDSYEESIGTLTESEKWAVPFPELRFTMP
ncbi:hypothetical protein, partial [uncultured Desulfobacter sp.]|uniref:hypothetical protein n=1 Tax=uncultured Desulfobacter sp. TaxID=240139 RepID=UPI00259BE972